MTKFVVLLVVLTLAAMLAGCSMCGSALQTTGNAFNKVGSSVKNL